MKSNGKLAAKTAAKRKTTSTKTTAAPKAQLTAKPAAKKNGKKRVVTKSTVPPQFRVLKQLAAAKDPRFWELRHEFRAYFHALPEEEREPFLEGLGHPHLEYLVMAMIAARGGRSPSKATLYRCVGSASETQ